MKQQMDHTKYPRSLKRKTIDQLRFIIQDAREASEANPEGENAGYYIDEMHYAYAELQRRRLAGKI
jgi:hypothetical protein